jgi:hypothetical protein
MKLALPDPVTNHNQQSITYRQRGTGIAQSANKEGMPVRARVRGEVAMSDKARFKSDSVGLGWNMKKRNQ